DLPTDQMAALYREPLRQRVPEGEGLRLEQAVEPVAGGPGKDVVVGAAGSGKVRAFHRGSFLQGKPVSKPTQHYARGRELDVQGGGDGRGQRDAHQPQIKARVG